MHSTINRYIIIGGVLLFVGYFIFLIIYNLRNPAEDMLPISNTPSPVRVTATPFPTVFIPTVTGPVPTEYSTQTGALAVSLPPDIQKDMMDETDLRALMPVHTDDFDADYDYKNYYFVITVRQSVNAGKDKFYKWLNQKGYTDIPSSRFVFQTQ